jgi:hypothetical protein
VPRGLVPRVPGRFPWPSLSDGTHIPLIRVGEAGGFVFEAQTAEHPKARIAARFTDDAGLHWQIDHDLHLEKLDKRDNW